MKISKTQLILTVLLLLVSVALAGCTLSEATDPDDIADNSTQIGGGESYFPNTGGSTDTCQTNADGECAETDDYSGSTLIGTTSIDFGLGELDEIECHTLTIPGNQTVQAEIDKSATDDVDGTYQFAIKDSSGAYSQERVAATGEISICYLREAIGTHNGQIKVVVSADGSSPASAYVITTSGETLDPLFNISSPQNGQIVDATQNEGTNDTEGDYLITARGTVNMDLVSILADGANTPIIIDADGVKYKTGFDADSGAFEKQIGLPQTPGVYTVSFSAQTTKGTTLTKSVSVVVAGTPELKIEVRDASGNEINSSDPTDVPGLVVGFNVTNLPSSGSDLSDMPVTIADIQLNGETLAADKDIAYDGDSWCLDAAGEPYAGFSGTTTFCVPLSDVNVVQTGINVISAKAKNRLGEVTDEFKLILDYGKPTIFVTSPQENELKEPGLTTITVAGTVENFAPPSLYSSHTPPPPQDGDTGSFCQPTSESDATCPESSVKLWFNVTAHDDNLPIYIYPEYDSNTPWDDGDPSTWDQCYTIEVTNDSETSTKEVCNIPKGEFKITLTVPSSDHHATVNLYTNILELRAESVSGHRTIKVVTFYTGYTSPHTREQTGDQAAATLTAGTLGMVEESCGVSEDVCVNRAPVMLNLSEGIFNRDSQQGKKIIQVLENYLNENLPFEDIANGWLYWPRDDEGNIDIEADFQRQYQAENNGKRYDDFNTLPRSYKERFIQQALHSNVMAIKMWALARYVDLLQEDEDLDCDERPDLCFFERDGDPFTEFNVARDSCGEVITTTFVPLGDIRHVAKHWDVDLNEIYLKLPEWTDVAGDNIAFNDFVSGKWLVHEIELKDGGVIDADICLVPDDKNNRELEEQYERYGCDADVSMAETPAFWGHLVSYNLVYGGLLGPTMPLGLQVDDPTMPLIWSIGKLRLKLTDVIRLGTVSQDNTWHNKITIDENNIAIIEYDDDLYDLLDPSVMGTKSIQIEPFANCQEYYQALFPGYEPPFGCSPNPERNYPFILEMNSAQGQRIFSNLMLDGQSTYLLGAVWQGVIWTFRKMLGCLDDELINPTLSDAYEFPPWVWEGNTLNTDFEWEFFNITPGFQTADLKIADGNITVRLPLTLGVDGVPLTSFFTSLGHGLKLPVGTVINGLANRDRANTRGHLMRSRDELSRILADDVLRAPPLESTDPQEAAFLGVSVNIEELFNAAAYLIFKKGPFSLLKTFGVDKLEPVDNWTVGIDKVILGRYDICDLAGLLPADLPKDQLFASVQSLFDEPALHLEFHLDNDAPPTLSLARIDDSDQSTAVKIGLTNVQIAVKELKPYENDNGETLNGVYQNPKDQEEVLRLRLDAVITLKAIYHKEKRQLNLFLEGLNKQNIHLSVVPGHGGGTYDDINVIFDVMDKIQTALNMVQKEYDSDPNASPTASITLTGIREDDKSGSLSLTGLMDVAFAFTGELQENTPCNGNVPTYYGDNPLEGIVFTDALKFIRPDLDILDRVSVPANSDDTDNSASKETQNDCLDDDKDNPIAEALCELGIDDITLNPTLIFDNDNGYIHVGAELGIELKTKDQRLKSKVQSWDRNYGKIYNK